MIGYIEGSLLSIDEDRILLLANQVGYEVLLPPVVMERVRKVGIGNQANLHIFFQQTERQPKPILIGFNNQQEKAFFQLFISVDAIGPMKAAKAMTLPVEAIAEAIESKNINRLKQLKGIGNRTAQKIIASLRGKMGPFLRIPPPVADDEKTVSNITQPVLDVLIEQLGHKPADAKKMISEALKRRSTVSTPEELFDEIYKVNITG